MKGITNASGSSSKGITRNELNTIIEEVLVPPVVSYSVAGVYIGCFNDNPTTSVMPGELYSATFTLFENYTLEGADVSVVMGGVDITASS